MTPMKINMTPQMQAITIHRTNDGTPLLADSGASVESKMFQCIINECNAATQQLIRNILMNENKKNELICLTFKLVTCVTLKTVIYS